MLSDYDLAKSCWNSYFDTAFFDAIYYGPSTDHVWCGIKFYPDTTLVVFRGSTTFQDWFRDFQSVMVNDPDLGGVEYGFMSGLRTVYAFLAKEAASRPLPDTITVTGHSLGAARAQLFTGLLTRYNVECRLVVFGPPRAGGEKLKAILSSVEKRLYKNRSDLVTTVPFSLPGIFDYEHIDELIHIDEAPKPGDLWGVLADHHSELYVSALEKLYPPLAHG